MRTASPVMRVWREPEVVPESGASSELAPMHFSFSLGRPRVWAMTCTKTVKQPWPMSEAAEYSSTLPSRMITLARPLSGRPTPTPEFFMAQAMPAWSMLASYTSLTASRVSFRAVEQSAICPLGSTLPGSMALR